LPFQYSLKALRSELQASFASRLGQRFDAAVVRETSTVERDAFDASSLGFFSHTLANQGRSGGVATVATQLLAHLFFRGRGRSHHAGAIFGDDAGVDVQVRAEDSQASDALLGDTLARLARTTQTLFFLVQHGVAPYFFLVSLMTTRSSA